MNIEIKDISFSYHPNKQVLDNVSFKVKDKEIIGILGGSGSGKSTILKAIAGIIKPSSGKINIDEKVYSGLFRMNGHLGMMYQQHCLLPNLTLYENILLPCKMNKDLKKYERNADLLIDLVGLQKYKYFYPKELSGGMQSRTELARTFITEPKLILLDEPFSSLDYGWKMDLYIHLKRLINEFKSTTIIVSHDINELVLLANKIIVLSLSGKILKNNIELPQKIFGNSLTETNKYLSDNNNLILEIQSLIVNDKNAN